MTDIELLDQYARGGSREALGEMVRRHAGWVNAIARRRVGDSPLAEDVTQAVFLVLAQKPPRLREEKALAAWLFAVANNACSRALRGEARRKKREKAFAMEHPEAADSSVEMSQEQWRELSPHLDEAVQAMSREDREAILLRFYQQKSHADVAAALGVSEEAARKRVQRAVGRLREILTRRGVQAPVVLALAGGLVAHAGPAVSAAVIQSALAATQGVAASAEVSWIAKGVIIMLTTKKVAAVGGICLAALLLGGGVTVMVMEAHRQAPPPMATTMPQVQADGEVYIGGFVPRSGVYSIGTRLLTLRTLIITAGGVDLAEGERYIDLRRKGADGKSYAPFEPLPASDLFAQRVGDVPLEAGDQIMVLKSRPTTLPTAGTGWRERFDRVYRLNDDELLKVIPPPFIAERTTYYAEMRPLQTRTTRQGPSSFTFHWSNDRVLSNWGYGFGNSAQPVSDVLRFVLDFKTYEVGASQAFLDTQIDGDWVLRKETTPEARLHALSDIVRQIGGPSLRFEQQLLPRRSIVVNGTYVFQPHAAQVGKGPLVHFYTEDAELQDMSGGGGGGTGTVRKMMEELGSILNLPVVDQRPEPSDAEISYYYHQASRVGRLPAGPERNRAIRTLFDNISKQTGLQLTLEERPAQVWVGIGF